LKKILVINLARLGDIVQAAPMLQALKKQSPDASITMLVNKKFSEICTLMPWVDETLELDFSRAGQDIVGECACIESAYEYLKDFYGLLKLKQFSRIINITPHYIGIFSALLAEGENQLTQLFSDWSLYYVNVTRHWNTFPYHMADLYKKIAGVSHETSTAKLQVAAATERWAEQFLSDQGVPKGMPLIGFHTGASTKEKKWPSGYFIELGKKIINTLNAKIILFGKGALEDISCHFGANCINAQGRTTISQLAALLQKTALLITNDTGPMHIAAACGTKIISLHMGKEMCRTTGPYGTECIAVQPRLDCHPCEHPEKCRQRTCMHCISPELVFKLARVCHESKGNLCCKDLHDDNEKITVYRARYDQNNLLDYYPCTKTELTLEDMCYRLLRIVWDTTLYNENGILPSPGVHSENIRGLVAQLMNYYQFPTSAGLTGHGKILRAYLETIKGYCSEGIQLAKEIVAHAAVPHAHIALLRRLSQQIEDIDFKIMGYGETLPALATLTHMFFVEKEHLTGEDIPAQAKHTLRIYENLHRRCRIMDDAARYFIRHASGIADRSAQEHTTAAKDTKAEHSIAA